MIRTTALMHFSQAVAYNALAACMANEKWRMLKARRILMGDVPAAAVAADTTATLEVAKLAVAFKAHTKTSKMHRR
eukprot:3335815-Pyramimonas_sp.AAC.1